MKDFKELEKKWQKYWEEHPRFREQRIIVKKEKKYVLVEFPYPSGSAFILVMLLVLLAGIYLPGLIE